MRGTDLSWMLMVTVVLLVPLQLSPKGEEVMTVEVWVPPQLRRTGVKGVIWVELVPLRRSLLPCIPPVEQCQIS